MVLALLTTTTFAQQNPDGKGQNKYRFDSKWIDLDGDGILDIVSTGVNRVFVVSNPTQNNQAEVIADVIDGKLLYGASGDIDGDGDLDFVVARETSPWIDYREKRARREKVKKPKKNVPDFSVAWIENTGKVDAKRTEFHLIEKDMHGCHGLELVDINGDGVINPATDYDDAQLLTIGLELIPLSDEIDLDGEKFLVLPYADVLAKVVETEEI